MSDHRESDRHDTTPVLDLASCEREPIHTPGAIQPHGAVLAALAEGLLVTHASANLGTILGHPAGAALGRPLAEVIGDAACRVLLDAMPDDSSALSRVHTLARPDGSSLDLRAHWSGRHVCVDIEPNHHESQQSPPIVLAQLVLETFKHTATRNELCELAVAGLRAITGYDRVMAYRFHEDGHGEVIAEARSARLEPYLGLHYPASDVPPQARRLYLRQRVGTIADASYRPVPLMVDPDLDDGEPLDLTHSALRSASPIHREYMRNMKTAASLTIGLAHGSVPDRQELWGMLVCHHSRPLIAGPELRAVAGMIGQVVSLLLASLGEAEVYAQRLRRNTTLRNLVERLAAPLPLPQAFMAAEAELLDLVDATGAAIRLSGTIRCLGRTPPLAAVELAFATLHPLAQGAVLAVEDVGLRHPELAGCTAEGSGALLLPFVQDPDDAILWFRPELPRTVAWAGDPTRHAVAHPTTGQLCPRTSFVAWKETVRGRSARWVDADLALARALRGAIEAEVAQRTKAKLARLRHYDALTGLPNRSLLQEKLTEAEAGPGTDAALLFLDLDRFKAINDSMGHAAGDTLLVEVANRLAAVAGAAMAARLGGDEFVVLCRGLDQNAVAEMGERIRQAIEAPYEIAGRPCHISASIGIAIANQSGELDLVRAADMAMYAAKRCGGNRGVMFERSLFDRTAQRFELEQDMREAVRGGREFALLYQPLFRFDSGTRYFVGFEALLRWIHPRHGWMSPELFVPLAETSGLMLPLGDWVLATALRQGHILQEGRPEVEMRIAVNVSALQLPHNGFCASLAGALAAEGFPAGRLCLQVTDSVLTDAAATAVLADIRALGVHVAISDFGVGTSSLSQLRRLPVDIVKLDGGFLGDVDAGTGGEAFVAAVVALALRRACRWCSRASIRRRSATSPWPRAPTWCRASASPRRCPPVRPKRSWRSTASLVIATWRCPGPAGKPGCGRASGGWQSPDERRNQPAPRP
jgi:diguanylate cyclase (GGDEF)-like protein